MGRATVDDKATEQASAPTATRSSNTHSTAACAHPSSAAAASLQTAAAAPAPLPRPARAAPLPAGAVAGSRLDAQVVQVVCRPSPVEQATVRGQRAASARLLRGDGKRARQLCSDDEDEDEGGEGEGGGEDGLYGAAPAATYGKFHVDRYLQGDECVEYQGAFVTRSAFEKLGGSLQAKWYRSIRVLRNDEPIGAWLQRHGLPLLKGQPRNSRPTRGKRGAKQARTSPSPTAKTHGRQLTAEPAGEAPAGGGGGGWVRADAQLAAEWTHRAGRGGGGGDNGGCGINGRVEMLTAVGGRGGASMGSGGHWAAARPSAAPPAAIGAAMMAPCGPVAAWRPLDLTWSAASSAAGTGPALNARATGPPCMQATWSAAADPAAVLQPQRKAPKSGWEGVDWLGQAWDHYLGGGPARTSAGAGASTAAGPQPSPSESFPAPPSRRSSGGPGTWAAAPLARVPSATSDEFCSTNWLGLGLGLGLGSGQRSAGAAAQLAWGRVQPQPHPPTHHQQQLRDLLQDRPAELLRCCSISSPFSTLSAADPLEPPPPAPLHVLPPPATAAAPAQHEQLLLSRSRTTLLAAAAPLGLSGNDPSGGGASPDDGAAAARAQLLLASAAVRNARRVAPAWPSGSLQLPDDAADKLHPAGTTHPLSGQPPVAKDFERRVQQLLMGGAGAGAGAGGRGAFADRYFPPRRAAAGTGGPCFRGGAAAVGGVPAAVVVAAEAGGGGAAAWGVTSPPPQLSPAQW
ncbi:hypothetical protein TSOC_003568 [Tetrabaena socialis]|uniref:Uncharacterized protein n=1 Tax=Tetrabaena socialis TaxID=47790 RepID=A0A2J8AB80_9CHLO|nr:hypothetical protein TSOC_003568 [Tetrabaena socialis]|eukprot:PNH09782.1 hypothetical protein TSOC_003568 [Tetrabaena socialis]